MNRVVCFWKRITSLAFKWQELHRLRQISTLINYTIASDPRDIRDLLEILRWPGEASLRRWRSAEATSYSLSCSSLLSAWPGARSLRLLMVVVVSKFQSWNLVVMVVSKLKSKRLWSQIYTAHSIVTSILTSMFIGVSNWVLIETQTNASWRATSLNIGLRI